MKLARSALPAASLTAILLVTFLIRHSYLIVWKATCPRNVRSLTSTESAHPCPFLNEAVVVFILECSVDPTNNFACSLIRAYEGVCTVKNPQPSGRRLDKMHTEGFRFVSTRH